MSPFKSVSFCFTYFGALLLGAYVYNCYFTRRTGFYLCKIFLFIPSKVFVLNCYKYSNSLLVAVCMVCIFHPFTFSFFVSLNLKSVSFRQYIIGYWFFIQSISAFSLFNPFTFNVIMNIVEFMSAFYFLFPICLVVSCLFVVIVVVVNLFLPY